MKNCLVELNSKEEPVIIDTGVTVATILERLSSDDSVDMICNDHHLTREQVHAALIYAEMNLPQSGHLLEVDLSDDPVDYSLLAENAGYFSTESCSLHLMHRYRKRSKPS